MVFVNLFVLRFERFTFSLPTSDTIKIVRKIHLIKTCSFIFFFLFFCLCLKNKTVNRRMTTVFCSLILQSHFRKPFFFHFGSFFFLPPSHPLKAVAILRMLIRIAILLLLFFWCFKKKSFFHFTIRNTPFGHYSENCNKKKKEAKLRTKT